MLLHRSFSGKVVLKNKKQAVRDYLKIDRGIVAIIGSGGKTSLMKRLSDELTRGDYTKRAILTTSTHIMSFKDLPLYTESSTEYMELGLRISNALCCGSLVLSDEIEDSERINYWLKPVKLSRPKMSFEELSGFCDYLFVEADGAARHPLKAHASYEPVIPSSANQVILVVGGSGWDMPIDEAVHRSELYVAADKDCSLRLGSGNTSLVSPESYARFLAYELETKRIEIPEGASFKIFINQLD